MHTQTHTHTLTHTHMHVFAHTTHILHAYKHTHTHTHTHTQMRVFVHTHILHVCKHTHTHACMHTWSHLHEPNKQGKNWTEQKLQDNHRYSLSLTKTFSVSACLEPHVTHPHTITPLNAEQGYLSSRAPYSWAHSSGAVWESRWTSCAVRPNEPSGFRGRKDLLHHASALVTTCP